MARAVGLPGCLGKKREGLLEHQHQEGSAIRAQYRSTKNIDVQANAIAGTTRRDLNPQVLAKIKELDKKAEYEPRNDYVKKDKVRRLERVEVELEHSMNGKNKLTHNGSNGRGYVPAGGKSSSSPPAISWRYSGV